MAIIRNFSIVAHIDHGKTTLTDRLMLRTKTIDERVFTERLLDSNPIEQERGITIKMAPVRMEYELPEQLSERYREKSVIFHLIDTPGHVDFSYEVSRSLAAVEGVILLVDVTQGVQAQTLSHYQKAHDMGLTIIPVLNKVDLINADVEGTMLEMMEAFGFHEDDFLQVSAKTGLGIDELMNALVERVPAPPQEVTKPLRAMVFNSLYDNHKGVIVFVRVVEGEVTENEALRFVATKSLLNPPEIGIFAPTRKRTGSLKAGETGYIATGLKDIRQAQVGDTLTKQSDEDVEALPGYHPPQLMVFMDFYPEDGDQFSELTEAMEKLVLNDSALQFSNTYSPALGNGLRVGFLGVLHAEIVRERLNREYNLDLITTTPSVRYEVTLTDGSDITVRNASELPDPTLLREIKEPLAIIHVYSPRDYVGAIMQLTEEHRGELIGMEYLGTRTKISYRIPLAEIIVTFFDELKSVSSGFASVDYEVTGYTPVKAVKLSILINHEPVEAFSQVVVLEKAEQVGKAFVKKLAEVIPRQLFAIPIQAAIGGKIIARETIRPFRKDVTAKLYGGDVTRRLKLLEKQKKGKKRRGQFGKVDIPQEAFIEVLKK